MRLSDKVVSLFFDKRTHLAPSQIDRRLNLASGEAKRIICATWRDRSEKRSEGIIVRRYL